MDFNLAFGAEKSQVEIRGSGRPSDLGTPDAFGVLDNNICALEIRRKKSQVDIRGSGGSPAVLLWAQICELGAKLAPLKSVDVALNNLPYYHSVLTRKVAPKSSPNRSRNRPKLPETPGASIPCMSTSELKRSRFICGSAAMSCSFWQGSVMRSA